MERDKTREVIEKDICEQLRVVTSDIFGREQETIAQQLHALLHTTVHTVLFLKLIADTKPQHMSRRDARWVRPLDIQ